MSMRDNFFARAIHGALPLLLWAAHFFASYALVAGRCSPAAIEPGAPGLLALALMSAAALAACACLLWIALRRVRAAAGDAPLHDWAALGAAVMAFAGIGWTAVPLFLVGGCG